MAALSNRGHAPSPPSADAPPRTTKPPPRTPPSPLTIATSVVRRLVNERRTYVVEMESQKNRIAKLETTANDDDDEADDDDDEEGNKSFLLGQEKAGLVETLNIFPPLQKRIQDAVERLEGLLAANEDQGMGYKEVEVKLATETVEKAKQALREDLPGGEGGGRG